MSNPVGLCTVAFKDWSIKEIADMAAAAGAEGLELWGQPPHVDYPVDPDQCRQVRDIVTSRGLEICALGSYFQPGKELSFDGVTPDAENQIRIAELLGTKLIRIWAGSANYDDMPQDERASVIESLRAFADSADAAGLTVVLERHGGSLTNSWTSPGQVLDEIDRRNVYLNYQVPHPVSSLELAAGAVDDFRRYLGVSAHAHIQNFWEKSGQPVRCFLDEGMADYTHLGAAIEESGYEGYFMVEFLPDDLEGLSEAEALKREINFLRRCEAMSG